MPFAAFLDTISLYEASARDIITVLAFPGFDSSGRTIRVASGDLVTLVYRSAVDEHPAPGDAEVSGDRRADGEDDGSRSRSPVDEGRAAGSSASRRVAGGFGGPGPSASCAAAISCSQLALAPGCQPAGQTAEMPLPALDEEQLRGQLSQQEPSGEEETDTEAVSLPEEWRVPVMIVAFQTAPRYDVLWIAHDEPPASWMVRAQILVAPPGGLFEIVLPDFQPNSPFLCLLAVPACWRALHMHAVLVCDVRSPDTAHLAIARPDDSLSDLLLLFGQSVEERISVFRGVAEPRDEADEFEHPAVAETFLYQPVDWSPPAFTAARVFLGSLGASCLLLTPFVYGTYCLAQGIPKLSLSWRQAH